MRFKGEFDIGEEGPGEEDDAEEVLSLLGAFGDLVLPSPDFVLERFYMVSTLVREGKVNRREPRKRRVDQGAHITRIHRD